MKIWVDTASGTWGEVDGDVGRLLIVDVEQDEFEKLDAMSDSELVDWADHNGSLAVPRPTQAQFNAAVESVRRAIDAGKAGTDVPRYTEAGVMLEIMSKLGLTR